MTMTMTTDQMSRRLDEYRQAVAALGPAPEPTQDPMGGIRHALQEMQEIERLAEPIRHRPEAAAALKKGADARAYARDRLTASGQPIPGDIIVMLAMDAGTQAPATTIHPHIEAPTAPPATSTLPPLRSRIRPRR